MELLLRNGHEKMNAHEGYNGSSSSRRKGLEDDVESQFRKEELVRLMLQSLQSLGMVKTAKLLQQESGFMLETQVVAKFRMGILEGNWEMVQKDSFSVFLIVFSNCFFVF